MGIDYNPRWNLKRERWAIFADVEGFSILWEESERKQNQQYPALLALRELMRAIFRVGTQCFPGDGERLFVHQAGDGFFIISNFGEQTLERPISIAIALMQHVVLRSGVFIRATIAEGEHGDYKSCYPNEVMDSISGDNLVALGNGIMSIFPTMGTAIIRSAEISRKAPKGPLLIIDSSNKDRIPTSLASIRTKNENYISINWVKAQLHLAKSIQSTCCLSLPEELQLEKYITNYCQRNDLPNEWKQSVHDYL